MILNKKLSKIVEWEYFWLLLILIITLFMHFFIISPPGLPFVDERYYVRDALNIISKHADLHPEHPQLAKLFIVAGIKIFGDTPLGWRFFSIIFGSISIAVFYLICRKLKLSKVVSSISTFILAFENLTFVQSSVAMLDIFLYTFMLLSFLLYLNRKNITSGIFISLSALVKINGILAGVVILIHFIFAESKKVWINIIKIIISGAASFFLLMAIFDYIIYLYFVNPFSRFIEILDLSKRLTFTNTQNEFLSRPLDWILKYKPIPYWYYPNYFGAISPSVWIMIIPIVIYLFYRVLKKNDASLFALSWFLSTYLFWVILNLLTNRTTYIYYFYPTIGSLCLGLGIGIEHLINLSKTRFKNYKLIINLVIISYLIFHIISFINLSPFFSFF
jgi:dolichyl-phosphate-mannose-protein mannosyltransferase